MFHCNVSFNSVFITRCVVTGLDVPTGASYPSWRGILPASGASYPPRKYLFLTFLWKRSFSSKHDCYVRSVTHLNNFWCYRKSGGVNHLHAIWMGHYMGHLTPLSPTNEHQVHTSECGLGWWFRRANRLPEYSTANANWIKRISTTMDCFTA